MEQADIRIINLQLVYFKNNSTGEYDKEMTKINYSIKMVDTDRTVGPAILSCYKPGNLTDKLKNIVDQKVKATINKIPTENGSKYVIVKINDKDI